VDESQLPRYLFTWLGRLDIGSDFMKVLVIKLGALGDVVRMSYILKPLHVKYGPDLEITWITLQSAFDLLRFDPYVDCLLVHERLKEPSVRASLKKMHFDLVISWDDEVEALAVLSEISYDRLIGAYLSGSQPIYSPDSSLWFDMGLISKHGKTVADDLKKKNTRTHTQILETVLDLKIEEPLFFGSTLAERRASRLFGKARSRKVGFQLTAGARWPSKEMPLDQAISLIETCLEKACDCYLFGGEENRNYNEKIMQAIGRDRLTEVPSAGILDLAGRIKCLDLLVCADTLALHLAIAQLVPSVSFFSPTSAAEIDVFGRGVKIASTSPDYCSYRPDADNSSITFSRVWNGIKQLSGFSD
jgi:heptosyltransferase-2